MRGLILAGGSGTRLDPTTRVYNKHLIQVYDRPMIFYPIETMIQSGITDIVISLSLQEPDLFMRLLGDGSEFGAKFTYLVQMKALGISYAINEARHLLGEERFLVLLGDNYFSKHLGAAVSRYNVNEATIFFRKSDQPERYGVLEFEGSTFKRVIEKPNPAPSNWIMLGAYLLSDKFFEIFPKLKPSERGEYEITDAINALMPWVKPTEYSDTWFDLGTPDDILACANYQYAEGMKG
mgnify:CR=1 FL=1